MSVFWDCHKDLLRETILKKYGIKQGESALLSITDCIVGPVRHPPLPLQSSLLQLGIAYCPPYQPTGSSKGDGRSESLARCPVLLDLQVR